MFFIIKDLNSFIKTNQGLGLYKVKFANFLVFKDLSILKSLNLTIFISLLNTFLIINNKLYLEILLAPTFKIKLYIFLFLMKKL